MNLPPYLVTACEEIDATVLSGDLFFNDQARSEFKDYLERWGRAIAEREAQRAEETRLREFLTDWVNDLAEIDRPTEAEKFLQEQLNDKLESL